MKTGIITNTSGPCQKADTSGSRNHDPFVATTLDRETLGALKSGEIAAIEVEGFYPKKYCFPLADLIREKSVRSVAGRVRKLGKTPDLEKIRSSARALEMHEIEKAMRQIVGSFDPVATIIKAVRELAKVKIDAKFSQTLGLGTAFVAPPTYFSPIVPHYDGTRPRYITFSARIHLSDAQGGELQILKPGALETLANTAQSYEREIQWIRDENHWMRHHPSWKRKGAKLFSLLQPQQGTFYIFDATLWHRVRKVVSGERINAGTFFTPKPDGSFAA
jgi:hypothetical protein